MTIYNHNLKKNIQKWGCFLTFITETPRKPEKPFFRFSYFIGLNEDREGFSRPAEPLNGHSGIIIEMRPLGLSWF